MHGHSTFVGDVRRRQCSVLLLVVSKRQSNFAQCIQVRPDKVALQSNLV